ncbi:MAG TPA: methyltransferase domain-containing protein [Gemmatimonadaceae bacterium]|nr:methyltransferase domain-containing protein [Gemmatimonadaceae bacterium]
MRSSNGETASSARAGATPAPAAWGERAHRWAPPRREGWEHLDDPDLPPAIRLRSVGEIVRANTLFGGTRAAVVEMDRVLDVVGAREVTLLDVGTGAGDIPRALRRRAARRGVTLRTVGLEWSDVLAARASAADFPTACASALAIPMRDRSVDIVFCSQLLHHFDGATAVAALREMHRVARHRVVVCDLRRSRVAAALIWLVAFPLRFHRFTRHDAVTSVRRGFTRRELAELVRHAGGSAIEAHRRLGFRVTATSSPRSAHGTRALGPLPTGKRMETVDERLVRVAPGHIFELARAVERWPERLAHYRWVRMLDRASDGGGTVEMAAWRDFGRARWPTWWVSEMTVDASRRAIRFRHVRGITRGMDVEWSFEPLPGGGGTRVRIVHVWDGPAWPLVGGVAARAIIGPVFIHAIASRTLAALAAAAEGAHA